MDEKLLKILGSISPSPEDTDNFGGLIIGIIKKSKALHDPKDNYAYLREFLKDSVVFLEQEAIHTAKYSPAVYHENVSRSRIFEKEVCQKLLDNLNSL